MNPKNDKSEETEFYLLMNRPNVCLTVLATYRLSFSDLVMKKVTTRSKGKGIPNLQVERAVMQVTSNQLSELRMKDWFCEWLDQDEVIIFRRQPGVNQIRSVRAFVPENFETQTKETEMKKSEKVRWFVQPLNEFTNQRICEHFNVGQNSDCVMSGAKVIMSGNETAGVDLIELSLDQKNILINTFCDNQDYHFNIFIKKGGGQIRLVSKKWVAGKPVFVDIDDGVSFDHV